MKKYWRPGVRVWWRSTGEAQLGVDPAAILFGLAPADHELLDALARADPRIDCWSVAHKLGWRKAAFAQFLARLPSHVLVDSPTADPTPMERYWSLMAAAGAPSTTQRGEAEVIIDGVDGLGIELASAVITAGVDDVAILDPRPVTPTDVHPGGFAVEDVGRERDLAAIHRLRPLHPMARLRHAPRGLPAVPPPAPVATGRRGVYSPSLRAAHPDPDGDPIASATLAVLIATGALESHRARRYSNRGIPVLPVVVGDLDIAIGPLLGAPGPCLRCMHLWFTDADPRWPAIATQLAAEGDPGTDPALLHLAVAIITHQVVAIADGRPSALVGASLHVDGLHPVPRHRSWQVHPRCGCQLTHLQE